MVPQAVLIWSHSPACLATAWVWDGTPHRDVTSLIRLTRAFWSKATASAHWCRWSWYRRQSCNTCWESSFSSLAFVGDVCPLRSPSKERGKKKWELLLINLWLTYLKFTEAGKETFTFCIFCSVQVKIIASTFYGAQPLTDYFFHVISGHGFLSPILHMREPGHREAK